MGPLLIKLLEYDTSETEIPFEDWISFVHSDDRELLKELMEKCYQGQIHEFAKEFRIRSGSGKYLWFELHGKVVESNIEDGGKSIFGIAREITSFKAAPQPKL